MRRFAIAPAARALLALGALAAVLFAPVLFAGRIFYERDIHLWFWGQAETFVRCLGAGSWPVWDPYLAFGHPLWANPGAQVLYPVTWAHLLVQPPAFYTLYVVSHYLFAGLGTYLLGRRIGLGFPAALAAAAFWTASGPFLSLASLWQHYAGIAWLPWVLVAGERAWSKPSAPRTLVWGVAAAGQALAGSVDACFMTAAVSAVWFLPRVSTDGPAAARRRFAAATGAGVVAVALSAALWVPAAELLRQGRRSAITPAAIAEWSLHPAGLGQLWLPLLPNHLPLRPDVGQALFDGRGEPLLASLYLGLALLPLVAAAFARRWRSAALILAAIGAGALLVALGHHTALLAALLKIPLLRMFRYPSKAVVVTAFAWALLAGLGLDAWLRGERGRGPVLAGIAGSLLAAGLAAFVFLRPRTVAAAVLAPGVDGAAVLAPVAGSMFFAALLAGAATVFATRPGRIAPCAVAALAVLDLAAAQRGLNPTAPAATLSRPPITLNAIERRPTTRIFAFSYEVQRADPPLRRPPMFDAFRVTPGRHPDPAVARALGLQMYLHSSVASRWGLATGYEADALGIGPRELLDLDMLLLDSEETPSFLRMMRLGAIDYVIALHREGLEELELVAVIPSPFDRPVHVYRVPDPLARVFAVDTVRVLTGRAAQAALLDPGFDPRREAVLSEGPSISGGGLRIETQLLDYAPDRIRAGVDATVPAYLVVVDAWAPGWRASVDGVAAPVVRANLAFRAVPVPPGRHLVELRYRPRSVRDGLVVSGLAVLGCLAIALRSSPRV